MNYKEEFLKRDLFFNSWIAAVQHNRIYSDNASDAIRSKLRQQVEEYINEKIVPQYINEIDEGSHLRNLENIKLIIDQNYPDILASRSISIGTVQKVLNLLLKYYWCCGFIKMPPHCPIDSIVLNKLKINDVLWTKIKTTDDYLAIINRMKKAIGKRALSEWELENWNGYE